MREEKVKAQGPKDGGLMLHILTLPILVLSGWMIYVYTRELWGCSLRFEYKVVAIMCVVSTLTSGGLRIIIWLHS